MIPQAVLTLNLLRASRINPRLSAHAQLHGMFDFNKTPLAPPGTRALVFEDPDTRESWATHGKESWYLGPALEHYRCYQFYIPDTKGIRITGSCEFFPHHCQTPTISTADAATHAAQELIRILRHPTPNAPFRPLCPRHLQGLRDLAAIFQTATDNRRTHTEPAPQPRVHGTYVSDVETAPPPRVASVPPQRVAAETTSSQPTGLANKFNPRAPTHRYPTRQGDPQTTRLQARSLFAGSAIEGLLLHELMRDEHYRDTQRHREHLANAVLDPDTGKPCSYDDLMRNPKTHDTWSKAMTKELARLAQGQDGLTEGTNTVYYMDHEAIRNIPKDRTVTYARIVVDYRPQKSDPNRVRITVGGNLIHYPGEVTTRTADMVTSKILWNSVLSTPDAKYCCADVKNFYLETPMDRYKCMRIPARQIPDAFLDSYHLRPKIFKGHLYMEIRRGMYGLPQAGIIANQLLRKRLEPHGYYEVRNTPGLWKHRTRTTVFSLVVDDFGIKYTGDENAKHLIATLEKYYTFKTDWTGGLYCGIQLGWHYHGHRHLDVSMPKYVPGKLTEFGHPTPRRPQHSPYPAPNITYGKAAQDTTPTDTTPLLSDEMKKRIQQIVGSFLYYGRACDTTILKSLNSLSRQQSKPTQTTNGRATHLLDYLATHPNAIIRFYPSDMILQIHSDASYISEPQARSTAGGHYFIGHHPKDSQPIQLNGAIYSLCTVLKHVAASAAEAELGALFLNTQEAKILRIILEEMGHPQPPTPIHCDNKTAVGIANSTVKRQRSRAMEMRYFWVVDQVQNKTVRIIWHPGAENLGDYVTKHHSAAHHQDKRKYYTHQPDSPRFLTRALAPSVLRGCVVPSRSRVPNVHPATVPAVRLPALPPVRPSVRPPAAPAIWHAIQNAWSSAQLRLH